MKIAFLSHIDINLYLFRFPIMKKLVELNHEVIAIVPKGNYTSKFKELGIKHIDYEIKRQSLNPLNEFKTISNIKSIICSIQPDILHTFMHKPNIYGNLSGAKNIINTVTGLGSFFIHNDIKSYFIRNIIEFLYKKTIPKAKKVVFQNSDDREYFIQKKIVAEDKAVLIKSSGVDIEYYSPMPKNNKLLKEFNLDEDIPIVLMIARVIKDKGVDEYIKAAELLKDKAQFIYVGNIDKGNKNAFIPDFKNVKYLGFRNDIKDIISISDIVVLPSYREGIPRTLLEAGSMEKPLITTDAPGCKEVVKDGYNGYLVPIKNFQKLAEKIKILLEDKKLREKMGKNSKVFIKKEFELNIVVKKYLELYYDIKKSN